MTKYTGLPPSGEKIQHTLNALLADQFGAKIVQEIGGKKYETAKNNRCFGRGNGPAAEQ